MPTKPLLQQKDKKRRKKDQKEKLKNWKAERHSVVTFSVLCMWEQTFHFANAFLGTIGVPAGGGGGGARGAAAPPKFWVTQVFWAEREIWAKPVFKDVFKFFF